MNEYELKNEVLFLKLLAISEVLSTMAIDIRKTLATTNEDHKLEKEALHILEKMITRMSEFDDPFVVRP